MSFYLAKEFTCMPKKHKICYVEKVVSYVMVDKEFSEFDGADDPANFDANELKLEEGLIFPCDVAEVRVPPRFWVSLILRLLLT